MRGRRPQPNAIKILRGNPGQRHLRPEPQPEALGSIAPPRELRGAARRIWRAIAPEAIRLRMLTVIDRPEFILACRLQALGGAALAKAEREAGEPSTKALQMLRQASGIFARFGVGASDRTRIAATPATPASKWTGLLTSQRQGHATTTAMPS